MLADLLTKALQGSLFCGMRESVLNENSKSRGRELREFSAQGCEEEED